PFLNLTLAFSSPARLRALSSGGSVASPPSSPAMPKYKLAEYRYGREEMLALYVKDNKLPDEIQDREFSAILEEEPLQPLALVPLTEEEQVSVRQRGSSARALPLPPTSPPRRKEVTAALFPSPAPL
uniref:GRB10 interacting GYF protein 1 n=1 Tax=Pseudonaja textilis TaxID=8673 RepID=A0A670Z2G1_PSETE